MEYDSTKKKKKNKTVSATWMNLEDLMTSEINRAQKEKYHITAI
jgi:hypothetical protein